MALHDSFVGCESAGFEVAADRLTAEFGEPARDHEACRWAVTPGHAPACSLALRTRAGWPYPEVRVVGLGGRGHTFCAPLTSASQLEVLIEAIRTWARAPAPARADLAALRERSRRLVNRAQALLRRAREGAEGRRHQSNGHGEPGTGR